MKVLWLRKQKVILNGKVGELHLNHHMNQLFLQGNHYQKIVVDNVLKWGTGAINIDGCRIEGNG